MGCHFLLQGIFPIQKSSALQADPLPSELREALDYPSGRWIQRQTSLKEKGRGRGAVEKSQGGPHGAEAGMDTTQRPARGRKRRGGKPLSDILSLDFWSPETREYISGFSAMGFGALCVMAQGNGCTLSQAAVRKQHGLGAGGGT